MRFDSFSDWMRCGGDAAIGTIAYAGVALLQIETFLYRAQIFEYKKVYG
jgi:hypothetical protein